MLSTGRPPGRAGGPAPPPGRAGRPRRARPLDRAGCRPGRDGTGQIRPGGDHPPRPGTGPLASPPPPWRPGSGGPPATPRGPTPSLRDALEGPIADPVLLIDAASYYGETGRPERAEPLLERLRAVESVSDAATLELAMKLADRAFGDLEAWEKALELVGPEGDDLGRRLARAVVFSRSPDPSPTGRGRPALRGPDGRPPPDGPGRRRGQEPAGPPAHRPRRARPGRPDLGRLRRASLPPPRGDCHARPGPAARRPPGRGRRRDRPPGTAPPRRPRGRRAARLPVPHRRRRRPDRPGAGRRRPAGEPRWPPDGPARRAAARSASIPRRRSRPPAGSPSGWAASLPAGAGSSATPWPPRAAPTRRWTAARRPSRRST